MYAALTDNAIKELNITSHMSLFLWELQHNDPLITASWIITKSGIGHYAPNIDPAQYFPVNFDLRNPEHDPSYSVGSPSFNPQRKTKYGKLYLDAVDNGVMVSAIAPVYNSQGTFKASTGIDISLREMRNEILHFQGLSNVKNSRGFAFIVDSDGLAVAFPPSKLKLLGLSQTDELLNLKLTDSRINEFNALVKRMLLNMNPKGKVERVVLSGVPYYIAYHSMSSTGWNVGLIYPEQDLFYASSLTRQSIKNTLEQSYSQVSIVALVSLFIAAVLLTLFLNKRLVQEKHTRTKLFTGKYRCIS